MGSSGLRHFMRAHQTPSLPAVFFLMLSLDVILIVAATPPLRERTGDEFLNKQPKLHEGSGFQVKPNANPPLVAELQLEQLKLTTSNKTEDGVKPQAGSKGILNLETPAVSDNSQPQPEGFGGGIDYDKVVSLSKIESDKRTESLEKSSTTSTRLKIELDYTPVDIAEYIFWTGDEPGVVSALNDFLQDELVDKDDVIKFLEDVKVELKLLKTRYGSVVGKQPQPPDNLKFKNQFEGQPHILKATSFPAVENSNSNGNANFREKRIVPEGTDEFGKFEYDDMVERMNRLNAKIREDSLREIIYHLAKEMFIGGSGEHSIQKFTHLVEEAAENGHIPKDLEKNILDTLVSALVDSVNEKDRSNSNGRTPNIQSASSLPQPRNIMKH